jgi:hypothetical protein
VRISIKEVATGVGDMGNGIERGRINVENGTPLDRRRRNEPLVVRQEGD